MPQYHPCQVRYEQRVAIDYCNSAQTWQLSKICEAVPKTDKNCHILGKILAIIGYVCAFLVKVFKKMATMDYISNIFHKNIAFLIN